MGAELIPVLQMAIWLIVAIMMGFVALYFYLIKPQNKNNYTSKSTYDSNNKTYESYNNQYDDGLNSNHEDDGPIQNL